MADSGRGMAKRVLAVDDEEGIRDAFLLALEDSGYDVDTASTGEEALEKSAQQKPDLLFLDLRMPGMGGVETLRRFRRVHPDTPVYIVTAFYQEFFEPLKALEADGIRFQIARKPLGADDILEITRSVLSGPEVREHG